MQILERLFNISSSSAAAAQEPPKIVSSNCSNKDKPKDVLICSPGGERKQQDSRRRRRRVECSGLKCEDLSLFRFVQRKDVSKPFFYHTLNLTRLKMPADCVTKLQAGSSNKPDQFAVTRLQGSTSNKAGPGEESAAHHHHHHVGNKVLPISSDSAQSNLDNKIKQKEKTKGISRMRDLIKWAAFTKGGKYRLARKVLNMKNNVGGLKTVGVDDDEFSNDSPKISFRWELESCSTTTSSVHSSISKPAFNNDQILHVTNQCANGAIWITTDSEFVVLEL